MSDSSSSMQSSSALLKAGGVTFLLCSALFVSHRANAGAFQLPATNAAGYGRAFAGGSLWADDPSAAYNNPAAMAWISRPVAQGSWIGIRPQMKLRGDTTDYFGRPYEGTTPNGGDKFINDGSAFFVQPLGDRFAIGAGIVVPYGLTVDYSPDWRGREFGTKTKVQSVGFSMSLSYKATDNFSLGAGVVAQRTHAQLNNGLDIGGTLAAALPGVFGPQDPLSTAQLNANLHNWSAGWFLGAEWRPTEKDSLGLAYHSQVANRLHGKYRMYYPNDGKLSSNGLTPVDVKGQLIPQIPALNQIGPLFNPDYQSLPELDQDGGSVNAHLDMPAFVDLDYIHRFNDAFSLGATVKWTEWTKFASLVAKTRGQVLVDLPYNYRNAFSFDLGGDWHIDQRWTLRGGLSYDQTPTHTSTRDSRIPDQSRRIAAIGLGYVADQHWSFDVAYQHQFLSNARVKVTNPAILGGGTMDGNFKDSGDVASLTATYAF